MSLEIRNLKPSNGQNNVSVDTNINFDIVALDGQQIDIDTLQITLSTVFTDSDGNQEDRSIDYSIIPYGYSYGYNDPDVCGDVDDFFNAIKSAITYTGTCISYQVELDPQQPFDLNQEVTVTIRVSDTDGVPMEACISTFRTSNANSLSEFSNGFLFEAQHIPVFNEIMRFDDTSSPRIYRATFDQWNKKPAPIVRVNGVIIQKNGTTINVDGSPKTYAYTVDYTNGKIIFDEPNCINDEVDVSYNFKCFSDEELAAYLEQATSIWQFYPPFGGPTSFAGSSGAIRQIFYIGGAMFAYQALIQKITFQTPRVIVDNRSWDEGWKQVVSAYRDIYNGYQDMWKGLLDAKKTKLPGMATITTPEFTLPGGRSRLFRHMFKGGAINS